MWDLILNPFVTVLTLLYSVFGNSAVVAIILFTVLVRLLMYPLSAQQMKSSKALQQIQPEMKKIQEKYKNDREKLAQEQMKLYREHGVNPLGGCLPLLIQFPIWIGLYQAINHALAATPLQLIDLSGRYLISSLDQLVPLNNVWLGMDLTQAPTANPTYALVLPVLVLITSWVQSKMITPPTPAGDNSQPNQAAAMTQSMTTIMPIMMGMFSLSFSVGLSIYFVASNVISIFQYSRSGTFQWKDLLPGKQPRPVRQADPKTSLEPAKAAIRSGQSEADTPELIKTETPRTGNAKPKPRPAKSKAKATK
jgi:YidC/Oxa1 family membrane protein insertase